MELRYIWPSELDLMAELAGLWLRERWGGWKHEPLGSTDRCVSVFERVRPQGTRFSTTVL